MPNIKENIGAQSFGPRAYKEEKKIKRDREMKERVRDIGKNINKRINFDENDLLTVEEVANILSISLSTAKKWVAKRKIPVVKFGGGKKAIVRVRRKDLDNWLEGQLDQNLDDSFAKDQKIRKRKKTDENFDEFIKKLKSE